MSEEEPQGGFFGGQELDEFMEELRRRGLLGPDHPSAGAAAPRAKRATASRIEYQTGVGKFRFPTEDSWAAHRQVVRADNNALGYWPSHNPYFDNIIHQSVDYEALWNDGKSEFPAYDVLRENLAIVRNYIMCRFFPDGSIDAEDKSKVEHLAQIARLVADGLNNDKLAPNPLSPLIRKSPANLPGTGAQYIYSQIVKRQNYFSWLDPIMHPIQWIKGKTPGAWDLPSLADSPFSDAALRMPPPSEEEQLTEDDIQIIAETMARGSLASHSSALNHSDELAHVAGEITAGMAAHAAVSHLQEPTKRESVDIAKEILKKLKLKIGEALIENGLTPFARENFSIMDALKGAVRVYEFHLHKLMQTEPHILENPAVAAANAAIGKLGYLTKKEALSLAEKSGNKELAESVRKEISKMPKGWQNVGEKTYGQLLGNIESGLDTVLMRLNQAALNQASSSYALGFVQEKTHSRPDPSQGYDDGSHKAMAENAYYQQINAQRQAQRQQAQMAMQNATKARNDEKERSGPNASARKPEGAVPTRSSSPSAPKESSPQTQPPARPAGVQPLVDKNQVASMRKMMATDAGAEAVQVSKRQAIIRQEAERRQQRDQQRADDQTQQQAAQARQAAQLQQQMAQKAAQAKAGMKAAETQKLAAAKAAVPPKPPAPPPSKPEAAPTIKAPTHNPGKRDPSRGI